MNAIYGKETFRKKRLSNPIVNLTYRTVFVFEFFKLFEIKSEVTFVGLLKCKSFTKWMRV